MAITWFRSRKTTRTAAPDALGAEFGDFAQPRGRHARPAMGAPVAYDASYDRAGWDDAERELLMAAATRPPWETGEGTVPATLRGTGTEEPDLSELTLTDKPLSVLRPETAPERTPAGPGLAAAPQARPYAPQDSGPPVSAELAPGPVAWLRIITPDGPVDVRLAIPPEFTGIAADAQGAPLAEFTLDPVGRVRIALDREALDAIALALPPGREQLVYGSLRAPAVPADPDAAGHREVLERELDDCLEQARGILRAAGNLGFISGVLRQRNGEGVMDVFVARAALANLTEGGDGAAAMEAARAFVGIIGDLCSDEVARSIANGIVPSDEAVARAGEAPEPEAAAEPGEVADEAVTAAGEAMAS